MIARLSSPVSGLNISSSVSLKLIKHPVELVDRVLVDHTGSADQRSYGHHDQQRKYDI